MCLRGEKLQYLKGEAATCSAWLLSVSWQAGAHLWHEGQQEGSVGFEPTTS